MADDKTMTPEEAEEKAKKDREAALEEQDNPPAPYPSQEQLNRIAAGEPLDDDDGDADSPAPRKPKPAPAPSPAPSKTVEAGKPGEYQTR